MRVCLSRNIRKGWVIQMAVCPIYQFYAELVDYTPRIWRRFQVANNITVARLGYIIMTMFEMQASHLFDFEVPTGENYREFLLTRMTEDEIQHITNEGDFTQVERFGMLGDDEIEFDDDTHNAVETKIRSVVNVAGQKLVFNYDFGDDWEVLLTLEETFIDKELPGKELPRVIAGEGFGIVEDCGGVGGLMDIAKAFREKKGEQYAQYCEWFGTADLNLDAFDMEDVNFRLKKIPRIFQDLYEYYEEPTQRSIDLIERKYLQKNTSEKI